MTDEGIELHSCPREDCDEPIIKAFRTDRAFQLRPDNVVYDKWCCIPRNDPSTGEAWLYVVIHGEIGDFKTGKEVAEEAAAEDEDVEKEAEADKPGIEDIPEGRWDGPDEDELSDEQREALEEAREEIEAAAATKPVERGDLDREERIVYSRIHEETVVDGSATLGDVKGMVASANISPSECDEIVERLVEGEYVEEAADAVLKAPRPLAPEASK